MWSLAICCYSRAILRTSQPNPSKSPALATTSTPIDFFCGRSLLSLGVSSLLSAQFPQERRAARRHSREIRCEGRGGCCCCCCRCCCCWHEVILFITSKVSYNRLPILIRTGRVALERVVSVISLHYISFVWFCVPISYAYVCRVLLATGADLYRLSILWLKWYCEYTVFICSFPQCSMHLFPVKTCGSSSFSFHLTYHFSFDLSTNIKYTTVLLLSFIETPRNINQISDSLKHRVYSLLESNYM